MKKHLIIITAMVGITASVFGQGQVTLANNAATLITSSGAPVAIGSTTFQLMAGAAANSLTPLTPTAGVNAAAAGRIANTIINVPSAPNGQTAFFQILAWASSFGTYQQALSGGGMVGQSSVFTSATSLQNPGDPIPTPVSLAGKYSAFSLAPVPEPSTIALGILGAGSLLFLRRKK
ncbi:MAG: PEP-CTERM sorting domain-containing protein [Verrucomicrobiota bacterium]